MRLYQVLDTTDTIQTGDKYPQVGRTIVWECLRPVPEEWVGKEVGKRLVFRRYTHPESHVKNGLTAEQLFPMYFRYKHTEASGYSLVIMALVAFLILIIAALT